MPWKPKQSPYGPFVIVFQNFNGLKQIYPSSLQLRRESTISTSYFALSLTLRPPLPPRLQSTDLFAFAFPHLNSLLLINSALYSSHSISLNYLLFPTGFFVFSFSMIIGRLKWEIKTFPCLVSVKCVAERVTSLVQYMIDLILACL